MKPYSLKNLLLAAVAIAATAGPIVAEAQPADRSDRQEAREERQQARQKARAERQTQRQTRPEAARTAPQRGAARVERQAERTGQADRMRAERAQRQAARQAQAERVRPIRPERSVPDRVRRAERQTQPTRTAPVERRTLTPERQRIRRQAQTQIQRSFNRTRWQQDFNRRHSDRRWWRSDRSFRSFNGVRTGFYFAPGYGYYNVPRQYYGRSYYAGSYLPSFFWRYRVASYSYWGLPPAPPGTAWVYVNNWILLVDLWDGYIIEAIPNAWYW